MKNIYIVSGMILVVALSYGAGRLAREGDVNRHEYREISGVEKVLLELQSLKKDIAANRQAIDRMQSEHDRGLNEVQKSVSQLSDVAAAPEAVSEEQDEADRMSAGIREFENNIQKEKEAYDNEIIDFTWAPRAENDLESGLGELTEELQFELVNSECRTTRCNATVAFDNYELAAKYGNHLAEVSLQGLNCAQSIFLPMPGDTSARYQASLMLDCSEQVQGLVQPNPNY